MNNFKIFGVFKILYTISAFVFFGESCFCSLFNPLNPGQFTRRVYRLPGAIRDKVSVSVLVFLAA